MKFEDYKLSPELKRNLSKLGLKRPTDIQYKSIPHIMDGEDVLAVAQTGTGKTAAFAVPIIQYLQEANEKARRKDGIKCIVMVPTHELAIQIDSVFKKLAKNTSVKTMALIGGVDQDPQISRLQKKLDLMIATPGRMFDLISQGHLRVNRVEILVLDEADHMLDLGFINDIRALNKKLERRRQTLFFSATINEKIKKVAYSLVRSSAIRIQISPRDPVTKNIDHGVTFVDMDHKRFFLERLVHEFEGKKILVFVRTMVRAERVKKAMERVQISSETIHRDKTQSQREMILKSFRTGENKLLIATDIAARGIDIPNVELVINYDLPDKAENYVHRVGRTGRAKKRGEAIMFCSENEKDMLEEIEAFLGKAITQLKISKEDLDDTILYSNEKAYDWKKLIDAEEEFQKNKKKRKKK